MTRGILRQYRTLDKKLHRYFGSPSTYILRVSLHRTYLGIKTSANIVLVATGVVILF